MVLFPLLAAAVSALFAFSLFRQFSARHRLPQLAWGVALSMYCVASLVVAAGIGGGWDPTLYRAFWLFGALLNVPWLALGSIALISNRAFSVAAFGLVVAASLWGVVAVAKADLVEPALATAQIPSGKAVLCVAEKSCDPVRGLARMYSLPAFAIVVLIALVSGRRRDGERPPKERVRGNWIIAIGATINAVGGFALVGKGRGGPFSVALAISVITMFLGFVLASRGARNPRVMGPETG